MEILLHHVHWIDPAEKQEAEGWILLKDGVIAQKGTLSEPAPRAERVLDGTGLVAAPGLVDMHVHLRDPGFTEKEDVFTGCRAAAAGGVTSLLCMPNTSPSLDSPEQLHQLLKKAEQADARVFVAAAISKGLKGSEASDWSALVQAGAAAFSDDAGRSLIPT